MEEHFHKFNVREFHIEDVNPTVNDKRTREICEEILARGLDVIWKISAGTKVETMRDERTIELMAKAGCKYISISPETGSPRVLDLINKPFKYGHAVNLVTKMNEVGIRYGQTSPESRHYWPDGRRSWKVDHKWEYRSPLTSKG